MAITTTLQTKFSLQKGLIIVLSLVLGLWGVYDYVVAIPRQQLQFERGQVCFAVRQALAVDAKPEHVQEANETLQIEFKKLADLGMTAPTENTTIDPEVAISSIVTGDNREWQKTLVVFLAGVSEASRRTPDATPSPTFITAAEMSRLGVDATADVSKPGKFDLLTQWMFILCLPCVPYFLWSFWRAKQRVYTLDDDGTLQTPAGPWKKDEIADIDMSKWMAKSVASVVHTGGARVKLDDYVYKNTHLIVGAIASEKYPDEWDDEARVVKKDEAGGGEPTTGSTDGPTSERTGAQAGATPEAAARAEA